MRTFFGPADYAAYIELLAAGCSAVNVAVLAYCLMPNQLAWLFWQPIAGVASRAIPA